MQQRDNGGVAPTNSDEYDLTEDLAKLIDSLNVATVIPNATGMNALTKFEGRLCFRLDTGQLMVCTDSIWRALTPGAGGAPFAMAAGVWKPGVISNGGSATSPAIPFPANRFTVAPRMSVGTQSGRLNPAFGSVTATNFILNADNRSGGNSAIGVEIHWTAVQMTPTSADG